MQFNHIGFDENGIVSFCLDDVNKRYYNPFLIACQAMYGSHVLDDYHGNSSNLIPRYIPVKFLTDSEISDEMQNAVEWLIRHCLKEEDCCYWLYDYPVSYGRQYLDAGWKSAFGQAYVALAMVLFYTKTGNKDYKDLAIGALNGMTKNMREGGCTNRIAENQIWFEEIPGENATHVFNAHMIGMVAISEAHQFLNITEFDSYLEEAMNAFLDKIEWMDTGVMSAYDIPDHIDFQLQLDSGAFGEVFAVGEVSIDDGSKVSVIDLKNGKCFEPVDNFASGIDWTSDFSKNGFRKVIDGRNIRKDAVSGGTIQNTYLNFSNISTGKSILKICIEYESSKDIKLILKKNCGEKGFLEISGNCCVTLPMKSNRKVISVATRSLFPDLAFIYHKYHIELLEALLEIRKESKMERTLSNFKKYINKKEVFDTEPRLESLSVSLNTQCGLHCKMCDLGIQNEEASIYKFLKEGGQNQQLDKSLLLDRCKNAPETLKLIHFVGTEPTLYKELPDLVYELVQDGKQVLVTTNGINLENTLVPILEAGAEKILISIDGPSEIHDDIRGKKGLFKQIMTVIQKNHEFVEEAKKKGQDIVACCAITPMNYLHLSKMVQELHDNGITDIWCTHMNYVDEDIARIHNGSLGYYKIGISCNHEDMNPKKVNPWLMYKSIRKASVLAKSLKMNFVEAPYISSYEDYFNLYHRPDTIVGQKVCKAPFRGMQINADGSACVMSRCYQINMGNISKNSLEEIFYSNDICSLRCEILNGDQWNPCKRCCAIM